VGVSAPEVADQVLEAIARASTSAVGQLNVGSIQEALKGGTAGAEKAVKSGR
jgi:hypothetical protein